MNIPESVQKMNEFMNRRDFFEPGWYQRPNSATYHVLTYINHIIAFLQVEIGSQPEAIAVFCSHACKLLKSPEAEEIIDDFKLLAMHYVYTVNDWLRRDHPDAFEGIDPFTIPELTDSEKNVVATLIPGLII